ncbi:hypothetical protein BA195_11525 [Tenacibaculum soleae]|uniref:PD-(D/E)XK nuclease superfamily protein n=1 Tax=Tenacibaculum soleae TaxID=447689 RepID=A0A1B9XXF1_9FLAO|nr:PD-(D/E)XK nuclease family protein [Tenacibaculum soleae]OCK42247.1 hypothetical protein BA195_11525 [Tenacibaculum soleae]
MTDFEKVIENVAVRLPKLPAKRKKNIYDILGVQTKETINSRVLAYFLNNKEEHQFNTLFIDALKELLKEKQKDGTGIDIEAFTGDFNVLTEDVTRRAIEDEEKQKRIDVSIEGSDWTIIIENKINHTLNNPLKAYWEHAQAKFSNNVIGVILSIPKLPRKECVVNNNIKYINITHKELIRKVQKNLIIGTKTNDLSLFYLKEYIKTIESHYKTRTDQPKMNELVNVLTKQGKHIKNIQHKVDESVRFIDNEIIETFKMFGYKKVKSWFVNEDKHPDMYFWIHDSKKILLDNSLWFCYESWDSLNNKVNQIEQKDLFKHIDTHTAKITHGNSSKSKLRTHIAKYNHHNFLKEGESFREAFTNVLSTYFMAENTGIVDKTIAHLTKENL